MNERLFIKVMVPRIISESHTTGINATTLAKQILSDIGLPYTKAVERAITSPLEYWINNLSSRIDPLS